ncbi:MAG: nucleotidyltransferase domain-containing protein [Melioribacteraceae bacterium]|nr:nucleotidyltransferase domain-containing protein [Melioribacteraceae bacterium]
MDKAEVVKKAVAFSKKVSEHLEFNSAVLFGSYVNGKPREDSDIDIAFIINDENHNFDYYNLLIVLNKLAKDIDSRIEPHIFTHESDSGFSEIIQTNGEELNLAY